MYCVLFLCTYSDRATLLAIIYLLKCQYMLEKKAMIYLGHNEAPLLKIFDHRIALLIC